MERKPVSNPFIRTLVSCSDAVSASVEVALRDGLPASDMSRFINFGSLLDEGPDWLKNLEGRPFTQLQNFNSNELWHEMISHSGFSPQDLANQRLISHEASSSQFLAAHAFRKRTEESLDLVLPTFGLVALTGKYAPKYIYGNAYGSKVVIAASEATELFRKSHIGFAKSPEEYLARLREIFPANLTPGDLSAFDQLIKVNAFIGDDKVKCSGIGLTRKLLEEFGLALQGEFGQDLISLPVAVDPNV